MPVLSLRVLLVGIAAGLLFAVLDGLLNANPLAQRLYAVYRPIARESVNAPLGLIFDLVSGVVMAGLFALLSPALPGSTAGKAVAFGLIAWFFRVAMGVAAQTVMFKVPPAAHLYALCTGALEMTILASVYACALRPR